MNKGSYYAATTIINSSSSISLGGIKEKKILPAYLRNKNYVTIGKSQWYMSSGVEYSIYKPEHPPNDSKFSIADDVFWYTT